MHARGGRVELTDTGHEVAELCREILGTLERFEEKQIGPRPSPG